MAKEKSNSSNESQKISPVEEKFSTIPQCTKFEAFLVRQRTTSYWFYAGYFILALTVAVILILKATNSISLNIFEDAPTGGTIAAFVALIISSALLIALSALKISAYFQVSRLGKRWIKDQREEISILNALMGQPDFINAGKDLYLLKRALSVNVFVDLYPSATKEMQRHVINAFIAETSQSHDLMNLLKKWDTEESRDLSRKICTLVCAAESVIEAIKEYNAMLQNTEAYGNVVVHRHTGFKDPTKPAIQVFALSKKLKEILSQGPKIFRESEDDFFKSELKNVKELSECIEYNIKSIEQSYPIRTNATPADKAEHQFNKLQKNSANAIPADKSNHQFDELQKNSANAMKAIRGANIASNVFTMYHKRKGCDMHTSFILSVHLIYEMQAFSEFIKNDLPNIKDRNIKTPRPEKYAGLSELLLFFYDHDTCAYNNLVHFLSEYCNIFNDIAKNAYFEEETMTSTSAKKGEMAPYKPRLFPYPKRTQALLKSLYEVCTIKPTDGLYGSRNAFRGICNNLYYLSSSEESRGLRNKAVTILESHQMPYTLRATEDFSKKKRFEICKQVLIKIEKRLFYFSKLLHNHNIKPNEDENQFLMFIQDSHKFSNFTEQEKLEDEKIVKLENMRKINFEAFFKEYRNFIIEDKKAIETIKANRFCIAPFNRDVNRIANILNRIEGNMTYCENLGLLNGIYKNMDQRFDDKSKEVGIDPSKSVSSTSATNCNDMDTNIAGRVL